MIGKALKERTKKKTKQKVTWSFPSNFFLNFCDISKIFVSNLKKHNELWGTDCAVGDSISSTSSPLNICLWNPMIVNTSIDLRA